MGKLTKDDEEELQDALHGTGSPGKPDTILLLTYRIKVSTVEQTQRLRGGIHDPLKVWKPSGLDLKSRCCWYDYGRAR